MRRLALPLVILSSLVALPAMSTDCFSDPSSSVTFFVDCQCYACAFTGGGCTACTDGSDTCYTNGASCEPGPLNRR